MARPNHAYTQRTKMDTMYYHPATNGKHKTKTCNNTIGGVTAVDNWMDIQYKYANHPVGKYGDGKEQ